MRYGRGEREHWSKFDYAATAAASLAYLLQQQQDAVGPGDVQHEDRKQLPPSSHPSHLKLMLHELEQTQPDDKTDVSRRVPRTGRADSQRGMVVLFSDLFVDRAALGACIDAVPRAEARSDRDARDARRRTDVSLPGQHAVPRAGNRRRAAHRAAGVAALRTWRRSSGSRRRCGRSAPASGMDYVLMSTDDPLDAALSSYLNFRQRPRRRQHQPPLTAGWARRRFRQKTQDPDSRSQQLWVFSHHLPAGSAAS